MRRSFGQVGFAGGWLADFRVRRWESTGYESFAVREGQHDDLVLALVIAAKNGGASANSMGKATSEHVLPCPRSSSPGWSGESR